MIQKVKADQLESWKAGHPGFIIVDVREPYEFDDSNIGGINIPLGEVLSRKSEIDPGKAVLFCCKSGKRSSAIAFALHKKYGYQNIYSLEGGLEPFLK